MNPYIIRKIDSMGRIIIPKDIRKRFNINENDEMAITVNENDELVISFLKSKCKICKSETLLKKLDETFICSICISKISELKIKDDF